MKYEIIPQEDTVLVTITDASKIDHLDMSEEPPAGCILVQKGRADVLGQIDLEKMLSNLNNCVDLLQITYNAVDSFHLQSRVQELSNQFIDAMNFSSRAASEFQGFAQDALEVCIYAYRFLLSGKVEKALELLTGNKSTAAEMVKVSDKLVKTYQGLTDYTNSVLKSVMDERADDEKKREQTKAMICELEGSVQAMETLRESLSADIQQLDSEYRELQEREIREDKRAFGMQLAALILDSIGSLVGMSHESMQSGKSDQDGAAQESQLSSAKDQAEREYSENIARQTAIDSQIKKIDSRIQRIDEVLDGELYQGGANNAKADPNDPDARKTDEELLQEKQRMVDEKARLNQELNGLKGRESVVKDTLKGLGVAVDDISEKTRAAAQEIQKKADSLATRLKEVGKKRDELKAVERKNLMDLARDTAKMKNMVMDANSLESAVQCLVIAIGCLRKVLAYLQEIKLFWMNVEVFCDNLANNSNLTTMIAEEECTKFFKSRIFVTGYLGLMAKWQALRVVFDEYCIALNQVSGRMCKTMQQSLSANRKDQWALARDMAKKLNTQLNQMLSQGAAAV